MLLLLLDIAVVFEVLLLLFMTVPELGKQIASVLSRSEKKNNAQLVHYVTSETD